MLFFSNAWRRLRGNRKRATSAPAPTNDIEHQAQENMALTICQFLTQPSVSGALLLNGGWGSGKSTFYRTRVAPALESEHERIPIYVSVAGASSVQEVEDRLFAAVHPYAEWVVGQLVATVWRFGLRHAKIDPKDVKIAPQLRKAMVICIDDIERFDGSTQALFGFIQNLLEEEEIPCLLIGAEEKFGSSDLREKGQYTYGVIREKIVAKSLTFESTAALALDALIEKLDEGAKALLSERKGIVLEVLAQDDVKNIRSLSAAIRDCVPVLKAASAAQLSSGAVSQLLRMMLASTFEARRDATHAKAVYRYLSSPVDWLTKLGFEADDSNPIANFSKRYANLGMQNWPAIPAIANYLSSGIYNAPAIAAELEELKKEPSQTPLGLLTGGEILELSEAAFAETQDQYYEDLARSPIGNLANLIRGANSLCYLANLGVAKLTVAETLEAHREALDRHLAAGTLGVDDYTERVSEEDALRNIAAYNPGGEDLARAIREAVPVVRERAAAAAREEIMKLLLTNFQAFESAVYDTRESWRHRPLFIEGSPIEAGAAICDFPPMQLARLREFFRWRAVARTRGMALESPYLVELAAFLRGRSKNAEGPLKRFGLITLARMIDHVVQQAY